MKLQNKISKETYGHFEGSNMPALSGGFLDVKIDNSTVWTVSIPRPYLMTNSRRESLSEWSEDFDDDDGNHYVAIVSSSIYEVDWQIEIEHNKDGGSLSDEALRILSSKIKIKINYTQET